MEPYKVPHDSSLYSSILYTSCFYSSVSLYVCSQKKNYDMNFFNTLLYKSVRVSSHKPTQLLYNDRTCEESLMIHGNHFAWETIGTSK